MIRASFQGLAIRSVTSAREYAHATGWRSLQRAVVSVRCKQTTGLDVARPRSPHTSVCS